LVGGPPGVELQTMVDGLPSGVIGETLPVVEGTIGAGMVPSVAPGIIDGIVVDDDAVVTGLAGIDVMTALGAVDNVGTGTADNDGGGRDGKAGGGGAGTVEPAMTLAADVSGCCEKVRGAITIVGVEELGVGGGIAGAAEADGIVVAVAAIAGMEATGTGAVPGPIWPVGAAQVTTVPGVVGSEAGGTAASVVSGTPGWVVVENGLGPLSGEDTIAPGVDGSPIAVVPMVETCARLV
jgi:hypothetical protein